MLPQDAADLGQRLLLLADTRNNVEHLLGADFGVIGKLQQLLVASNGSHGAPFGLPRIEVPGGQGLREFVVTGSPGSA